jgi:hypothetical protein
MRELGQRVRQAAGADVEDLEAIVGGVGGVEELAVG